MADASHPFDARRRRPRDWGDAFSNLPLETPPLSVWSDIAARLDGVESPAARLQQAEHATERTAASVETAPAARGHRTGIAWLALAASLSALALLPILWSGLRQQATTTPEAATTTSSQTTPVALPARDAAVSSVGDGRPRPARSEITTSRQTSAAAMVAATAIDSAALDAAPPLAYAPTVASPEAPLRIPREPDAAEVANAGMSVAVAEPRLVETTALPANAVLVGDTDADATAREMELLYAASAQLETLLTYTHAPRVETGPAAALSSEIHTRLAKIDARLAQPGLSSNEQYALWHARVGTLRQAVAVENELRALSAEGQGYEGQLVEVY